jgi:hypothetical protein
VRHGAAELFFGHFFMGHRLDDVRPGDEHVGSLVDHDDEVGDGRRIDRATRAWAHNRRNLRYHAAVERVAQKNIGIAGQRRHAFLNARTSGVVQADHGRAHLRGKIHDLDDLRGVCLREGSAEDGEILREDIHQSAFDAAVAGDKSVAVELLLGHAEVVAAVRDQFVGFFEGAVVEQKLDALAGRHLAFFMLAFAALLASAGLGKLIAPF